MVNGTSRPSRACTAWFGPCLRARISPLNSTTTEAWFVPSQRKGRVEAKRRQGRDRTLAVELNHQPLAPCS